MPKPGVTVTITTAPTLRSSPTNSGVAFFAGLCDAGAADAPIQVLSLDQFVTKCGGRVSYSSLYDSVDLFFRTGGNTLYIGRVVGPAAAKAAKNILDAGAGISLVATAVGPGSYYNALKIQILAGTVSGYQIQILDANNVVLENSGDLADQASGIAWSLGSNYFRFTLGATALNPAVAAAASPTGGADDRASIVDAQWATAIGLWTADLGPGQVAAPGRTSDVGHQQLVTHASLFNRRAVLDSPDLPLATSLATITTSAGNAKQGIGQFAAFFWGWITCPGPASAPTVQRTVPPSPFVCARIAATDAIYGSDTPAAGDQGAHSWPAGVSQKTPDDTTWSTAYAAGVNVIFSDRGLVTIFGWKTLADPINLPAWLGFGVSRYLMSLAARLRAAANRFDFTKIDGKGETAAALGGALTAICDADYALNNLYGATAKDAYLVSVASPVNTDATAQAGSLNANVAVRPAPDAEFVNINIVNTPVTQAVS